MMIKQKQFGQDKSIFDIKPKVIDTQDIILKDNAFDVPSNPNTLGKNASSPCTSLPNKYKTIQGNQDSQYPSEQMNLKKEMSDNSKNTQMLTNKL